MAPHTEQLTRPAVQLRGLTRSFEDRTVLDGIDLDIPTGQFVALLGHSGSGKSTLLRAIAGLDHRVAGSGQLTAPERVSPVTRAQEGDWAVHEMERLHVDVSLVSPAGISIERGLTEATPSAAAVSQLMVASGEQVIALAGPDSFGISAFVQFASLDQIDSIAVAGSPSQGALQPFLERNITITVGGTS